MERSDLDLKAMVRQLEASGLYRILRLEPRSLLEQPDGSETRLGLFVDVETTGLDPANDEIIELAMVPFTYASRWSHLRDTSNIPAAPRARKADSTGVTNLTGITNEMVAGHMIDAAEVAAFARDAALVVAHNAAFDRPFVERLCGAFATKAWSGGSGSAQIDACAEWKVSTARRRWKIMLRPVVLYRHFLRLPQLTGISCKYLWWSQAVLIGSIDEQTAVILPLCSANNLRWAAIDWILVTTA